MLQTLKFILYAGLATDRVSYPALVNETTVFMLHSSRRDGLFRSKLRQLAERSEALCAILLATHLYVSNPDDPSELFEEYYLRGLSLFRNQLESFHGSIDLGAMYAGLFICTLNVSYLASGQQPTQVSYHDA